jgi:hypothetical protein
MRFGRVGYPGRLKLIQWVLVAVLRRLDDLLHTLEETGKSY